MRDRAVLLIVALVLAAGALGCIRSSSYTAAGRHTTMREPLGESFTYITTSIDRGRRALIERRYWARLVRAPDDPTARLLYALTLENGDDSLRLVRAVLASEPDLYWAHVALGRIYARRGRGSDAAKTFQRAIALNRFLAEGHLGLASVYVESDRRDEAKTIYLDLAKVRPYDARVFTALGHLLRSGGENRQALESYERAAALDVKAHDALLALGEMYRDAGDLERALAGAERAAEADPESAKAHILRARLYVAHGLEGRAAEAFAEATKLEAEILAADAALRHEAAMARGTHALAREKWAAAADAFSAATEADPTDPVAWRALATAHFARAHYAKALDAVLDAERAAPDDESVKRAMSALLERIGTTRTTHTGSTEAEVMKSVRGAVGKCFAAQVYRFPSLAGELAITVKMEADGAVVSATIESDTVGNAEVAACARLHFLEARFPPGGPAGSERRYTLPLGKAP